MSDVDEIRSRIDIAEFVGSRVKLKKAGRNLKGLCPFHNEKSPSFVVSPERGIWHCFGCSRGGSVFDFVMEYEQVDFVEALETLAEIAGVTLSKRPSTTPQEKLRDKIFEVNHLASEYYQYLLKTHDIGNKARAYVNDRGISDKSQNSFGLGYSPNGWEGLLTFLTKKGYDQQLLVSAGLVLASQRKKDSYYDRFRGRLMFPLRDHRGRVCGFAGRLLDPAAKEAKYINTSETSVYKKSNMVYGLDVTKRAIQDAEEVIVMEGELDVISSFQIGVSNVVAIKGSALTEGQVRLLKRFAKRIVFALDSDFAGDQAARRGIEIADRMGLELKVAKIEGGKDPDDLARSNPAALKKAIKTAVGVYDFYVSSALSRHDVHSAYGKKRISDELLPVIAKIDNQIVQSHYVKKLAATLGISEQAVTTSVDRTRKSQDSLKRPMSKPQVTQSVRSRQEKLEIYILALLMQGKTRDLYEDLIESVSVDDFTVVPVQKVLRLLEKELAKQQTFFTKDFAEGLPEELMPVVDEAYLHDLEAFIDDENLFMKEWIKLVRHFKETVLRNKIRDISSSIGTLEDAGHIADLQQKLKSVTAELSQLAKSG